MRMLQEVSLSVRRLFLVKGEEYICISLKYSLLEYKLAHLSLGARAPKQEKKELNRKASSLTSDENGKSSVSWVKG